MTLAQFPPHDYDQTPKVPVREPMRPPQAVIRPDTARPVQRLHDSFRLLNDVELMELPDPRFLVQDILPEDGLTFIYGLPGSCKTILIASLAVSIATGRNWYGHQVKSRGASIYVAAEDTSGWKVRLRSAKRSVDVPAKNGLDIFTFPESMQLLDDESVERFLRLVQSHNDQPWFKTLRCVFVDTYAASTVGGNENSSEDTTKALSNARRIMSALKCSVVIVHHANASGNRERGHSGLRGAADAMIELKVADTVIEVESSKIKNGAPFRTLELRLDTTTYGGPVLKHCADLPDGPEMSSFQRNALRALSETFTADGATNADWMTACGGMAAASFYRAKKSLIEERGFVVKQGTNFKPTPIGRTALGL